MFERKIEKTKKRKNKKKKVDEEFEMKVKKKTLRKMSRALAFMMAVVIVLTSLGLDSLVVNAADPDDVKPGATASVESVLGEAINYGLVANDITFVGHFETNFAVKTIHDSARIDANGPMNDGFVGNVIFANYVDGTAKNGLKYMPNDAQGKRNTGEGVIYTTKDAVQYLRSEGDAAGMIKMDGNGDYYYVNNQGAPATLSIDYKHIQRINSRARLIL